MPTHARKAINKLIEETSQTTTGRVLFVGVNYQWEKQYREWFKDCEFVTIDINPNTVIKPDIVGDIQKQTIFKDEHFDLVIMVGIWELLDYIEDTKYEILRILKEKGKLFFGFPGDDFRSGGWDPTSISNLLDGFFKLEKLEVIYYKSDIPFYILGIARK